MLEGVLMARSVVNRQGSSRSREPNVGTTLGVAKPTRKRKETLVEHKQQYVGIDLHRRRSVIVRMTEQGEVLSTVQIENDPVALAVAIAEAGPDPEVGLPPPDRTPVYAACWLCQNSSNSRGDM